MKEQDSIEKFLYSNSPGGFPMQGFYVSTEFEVGGAYEDWGWVIYKGDEVYACHKHLQDCLKLARNKYRDELKRLSP